MKRYDLYVNTEFDSISAGMEEQHDGEYVKWEDVEEILKDVSNHFDDLDWDKFKKKFEL
jgi:hypothetical protein